MSATFPYFQSGVRSSREFAPDEPGRNAFRSGLALSDVPLRRPSSRADRSLRAPAVSLSGRGRAFYCMPLRRTSLSWLASFAPS